jgi:alpha-tubulin suppressor-like RCC1 family protein
LKAIALDMFAGCAIAASANEVECWGPAITKPGLAGVTAISSGLGTSCALELGAVWCWGRNDEGQTGDGTTTDHSAPIEVSLPAGNTAIASGNRSCAVISTGGIKCWGGAPLGDGTLSMSLAPVDVVGISTATQVAIGESHACALLSSGSVKCWGAGGLLGDGTSTTQPSPVDVAWP